MSGVIAQNTLDNTGLIKAPEGGGAWTFIKKLTASSSGTLDFVNGTSDVVLDSTYKEYIFYFVNIHPSTASHFSFQGSTDAGSSYGVTITTTVFQAEHSESGGGATVAYQSGSDESQATDYQNIMHSLTAASDDSGNGYLHLFNPSSTTFVKHFLVRTHGVATNAAVDAYTAGYFNTTSAIDAIQFKMSSGNIDAGDIFLHGLTI